MTLRYIQTGEIWRGEVIRGRRHPLNIEKLWSDASLAAIGLQKVPVDRTVTPEHIAKERARRMQLGFDYDFGDKRGVHRIGTTAADMTGWNDVIILANALIDTGDTTTLIDIWTDTGQTEVTAPEWQAIVLHYAGFKQFLWKRSFELQALQPIPEDYANDNLWTP